MGFQSSRFKFNSSRGQFHSSGMTDGESVTGSASIQSFEQRQQIEKNRQTIASYRDAAVTRMYRNDVYSPDSAQKKNYGTDVQEDLDKQKALHRKRSSRVEVDEQSSSKIRQLHSSRIDVVKSSRQGFNAKQSTHEPTHKKPRYTIGKPSFREPGSRGYNPYS